MYLLLQVKWVTLYLRGRGRVGETPPKRICIPRNQLCRMETSTNKGANINFMIITTTGTYLRPMLICPAHTNKASFDLPQHTICLAHHSPIKYVYQTLILACQ